MIHSNFPVNAVYQWSRGPEEAILYIGLRDALHLSDEVMKERVRDRLAKEMPDVRFSFEPSDIVNEVMSFGAPTPIEVVVSGSDFGKSREFAEVLRKELAQVPALRDLQLGQSMDYPTVQVNVDREKAGLAGLTPVDVSRALVTATSSSRLLYRTTGPIRKAELRIKCKLRFHDQWCVRRMGLKQLDRWISLAAFHFAKQTPVKCWCETSQHWSAARCQVSTIDTT